MTRWWVLGGGGGLVYIIINSIPAVSWDHGHSFPQNFPATMQEDPDQTVPSVRTRLRPSFRPDHEHRGRAPRQHLLQTLLLLRH